MAPGSAVLDPPADDEPDADPTVPVAADLDALEGLDGLEQAVGPVPTSDDATPQLTLF
jgi:hypothetical protein